MRSRRTITPAPCSDHTTPMAMPRCLLNHRETPDIGSTVNMEVEMPRNTPKKR